MSEESNKNLAYDIVKSSEGKEYTMVHIEYDLTSGEAKVVKREVIGDNSDSALFKLNKAVVNKLFGIKE